jgi:hypothetical protein
MKKLLVVLLLLCSSVILQGQKSSIYISLQPADLGVGIRGNYHFEDVGVYGSITYGNGGVYKRNYLTNHIKLTTGVMVPIFRYEPENMINGYKFFATVGINYHSIGEYTNADNDYLNPKIFNPWSFELGLTSYVWKRFTIGLRTDILRWEPCVDVGWRFKL